MRRITRSEFLTLTALTGGAAFLAACGAGREAKPSGAEEPGRALPTRSPARSPAAAAGVLAVATGPAAAANTEKAVAALGGMGTFVRRGDVVVVKPNICTARAPEYAATTNPLGAHPLYAAIVEADVVISAPIAKQHGSAGLTLAGKNLMGATSDRGRMHSIGLSQCIAELAAALRPDLAVIDATRILVRNGPTGGDLADVVAKDTVIACADWVAADAYATRLFDKTPDDVPYIKAAADMGLGTLDLRSISIRSV